MKDNFRCPRCRTMQKLTKKHMRAVWTCPHCKNQLIPKDEYLRLGYMPFKRNAMFSAQHRRTP